MILNGYKVKIVGAVRETNDGYVEMKHDTQYSIQLSNSNYTRCDAEIRIDGKIIGTFRIDPYSSVTIERSVTDDGRFTFYKAGSKKAIKSNLQSISRDDLGVVSVVFMPEKSRLHTEAVVRGYSGSMSNTPDFMSSIDNCYIGASCSAGGTGLSGQSAQDFYDAEQITTDACNFTMISLRLIVSKESVRELRSVRYANPIPSPR